MKDKNGVMIEMGATVLVPDPNETDIHNHGFQGHVIAFKISSVLVEDGDNDCFELEPERLEIL